MMDDRIEILPKLLLNVGMTTCCMNDTHDVSKIYGQSALFFCFFEWYILFFQKRMIGDFVLFCLLVFLLKR